MKKIFLVLILLNFIFISVYSEENDKKKDIYYLRCSIYPVYSLARLDINIDNNLLELRIFADLRENNKNGDIVDNAIITLENQKLKFEKNYYMAKIKMSQPQKEINLKIKIEDKIIIDKNISVPNWLKLISPKPHVIEPQEKIILTWQQSYLKVPVNVKIYDFKNGKILYSEKKITGKEVKISTDLLKDSELVRILIKDIWRFNHYIDDEKFLNEESEINFQSWSQNFLRIKKIDEIKKYIEMNQKQIKNK